MKHKSKQVIGWREWACLPQLHIDKIKLKIDTGARTSTLHAINIEPYSSHEVDRVRFLVHPFQKNERGAVLCRANVVDLRTITDSGGKREHRYIIETHIILGSKIFTIEVSLTDRSSMGFRMLLGRSALKGKFVVDPHHSYLLTGKH
jgi:hypothetical protein